MSKKVALVLSSGGARGLAHIGVIESLIEDGYEITSISGSSIGAVVGAFYSCGELETYKKWACNLDRYDVFKLIDFTFSVQGFIKGEKVFKALQEVIADRNIEDFNIPFSALVTDIKEKKEVVLDQGSMYEAIQASVAIPTVIKPVVRNGREFIDGGVTNPIPIDHVKRHAGDMLVVSNVNAIIPYHRRVVDVKREKAAEARYNLKIQSFLNGWNKFLPGSSTVPTEKKLGFFDLLNESIDLMQDRLTSLLLDKHRPDILVNVSREACSTFEFYKCEELINAGKEAYRQAVKEHSVL
ncbi:patatin-like phospholipase family protein [Marinoscillum pacificum]|uniref:patatin-like phospholipase family protein n=1 Tax=Marinoscillum pacificum TaxID=392723 RepID=UPI002157E27D|nr:patatin-like phospholipase family protein [Marinoscillum pacificum]